MEISNKKLHGNAVAFVIILVAVLATVYLALQVYTFKPTIDVIPTARVQSESTSSVDKAARLALSELLQQGYSVNSSIWYCNQPTPPDLREVVLSGNSLLNQSVISYLNLLSTSRSYSFDGISLSLEVDGLNLNIVNLSNANQTIQYYELLSNNQTTINSTVFVNATTANELKRINLSNQIVEPFPVWGIYNTLLGWMNTDMNSSFADTCNIFNMFPCRASQCQCYGAVPYVITPQNISDAINLNDISGNFTQMIEGKVADLNQMFVQNNESSITCNVSFPILNVALNVSRNQTCLPVDGCDVIPGTQTQDFEYFTSRGQIIQNQCSATPPQDVNPLLSCPIRNFTLGTSPSQYGSQYINNVNPNCPALGYESETIAMNPQLFSEVSISCSDANTMVSTPGGLQPLTATIRLIFSAQKTCSAAGAPVPPTAMSCTGNLTNSCYPDCVPILPVPGPGCPPNSCPDVGCTHYTCYQTPQNNFTGYNCVPQSFVCDNPKLQACQSYVQQCLNGTTNTCPVVFNQSNSAACGVKIEGSSCVLQTCSATAYNSNPSSPCVDSGTSVSCPTPNIQDCYGPDICEERNGQPICYAGYYMCSGTNDCCSKGANAQTPGTCVPCGGTGPSHPI